MAYLSLSDLLQFLPNTSVKDQAKNRGLHVCWDRKNESSILFAWVGLEKHIAKVCLVRVQVDSHPACI
jgi:hypothetical protein